MANKKKYDAVYSGEKYTDREGNEKTRYINIGVVFERDDGSLSLKLESLPVNFSGWVNFYEPKADNEKQAGRAQQAANQARGGGGSTPPSRNDDPFPEDSIPFVTMFGTH